MWLRADAMDPVGLAEAALKEAREGHQWTAAGQEGEVRLNTCAMPGALPMVRGQVRLEAPLGDLAAVLLSDGCRRFWDPSHEESQLLQRLDGCAVLCALQRASPVSKAAAWVHVAAARHDAGRLTYACADAEGPVPLERARSSTRLWAVDAVRCGSAWEVSLILHTAAKTIRLPSFLLRPLLSSWVALCLSSLCRMAFSRALPKGPVCPVCSPGTQVLLELDGRQLQLAEPVILTSMPENAEKATFGAVFASISPRFPGESERIQGRLGSQKETLESRLACRSHELVSRLRGQSAQLGGRRERLSSSPEPCRALK